MCIKNSLAYNIWRNVSSVLKKLPSLSFSLVHIKSVRIVANGYRNVPSAITRLIWKSNSYQDNLQKRRVQEYVESFYFPLWYVLPINL